MFLPEGSQDQIGDVLLDRAHVYEVFKKVALSRAFKPIETPVVEFSETFTNPHVGMPFNQMLKWFDRFGEVEVLRPDWTTAIARALMNQDPNQLKWFYQGSVFRQDKNGIESQQAGIEIIRTKPLLGEVESLFFAVDFLNHLEINNYLIELGHTDIYETIIEPLSLTTLEDKRLRQAMHDKRKDLVYDIAKGNKAIATELVDLINAYGDESILDEYKIKFKDRGSLVAIIDQLQSIFHVLKQLGVNELIVDLGRVKQLPYYSGMMFRGYLKSSGKTCFTGGRYDKLYAQFNQSISAVGLAFDVDVLKNMVSVDHGQKRVCIIACLDTHVLAELKRESYKDAVVDIVYQEPTLDYDEILDLRNEEIK